MHLRFAQLVELVDVLHFNHRDGARPADNFIQFNLCQRCHNSSRYLPTLAPPVGPRPPPMPGAAVLLLAFCVADPVSTWSPALSDPLSTCATSVVVWSVMPSLISAGSIPSCVCFQTTETC